MPGQNYWIVDQVDQVMQSAQDMAQESKADRLFVGRNQSVLWLKNMRAKCCIEVPE